MQHSLNLMTNLLALFDLGFAQVIGRLKIQPKLSRSIKGCGKAQGHVGTDAAPLSHDFIHRGCGDMQRLALSGDAQPLSVAMSITKRYFTSLLSMRS